MVRYKIFFNVLLMVSGYLMGVATFSIMVGNYFLMILSIFLAGVAFYYNTRSSEKHESEIETDAFLEGYKRGLKRGRQ
jgi:hypothetical protein